MTKKLSSYQKRKKEINNHYQTIHYLVKEGKPTDERWQNMYKSLREELKKSMWPKNFKEYKGHSPPAIKFPNKPTSYQLLKFKISKLHSDICWLVIHPDLHNTQIIKFIYILRFDMEKIIFSDLRILGSGKMQGILPMIKNRLT